MITQDGADRLMDLCRKGEYMQAQKEAYADRAVSIEPERSPWQSAEGIAALKAVPN